MPKNTQQVLARPAAAASASYVMVKAAHISPCRAHKVLKSASPSVLRRYAAYKTNRINYRGCWGMPAHSPCLNHHVNTANKTIRACVQEEGYLHLGSSSPNFHSHRMNGTRVCPPPCPLASAWGMLAS